MCFPGIIYVLKNIPLNQLASTFVGEARRTSLLAFVLCDDGLHDELDTLGAARQNIRSSSLTFVDNAYCLQEKGYRTIFWSAGKK